MIVKSAPKAGKTQNQYIIKNEKNSLAVLLAPLRLRGSSEFSMSDAQFNREGAKARRVILDQALSVNFDYTNISARLFNDAADFYKQREGNASFFPWLPVLL